MPACHLSQKRKPCTSFEHTCLLFGDTEQDEMRNMSPPSMLYVVYKYIYIAYENMVVNTVLVNIYLGHIFACTNTHTNTQKRKVQWQKCLHTKIHRLCGSAQKHPSPRDHRKACRIRRCALQLDYRQVRAGSLTHAHVFAFYAVHVCTRG